MKKRSATLKIVQAAALMLMLAFTWSAVVAQETPDDPMVAPTAEPPPPHLTEAEKKARSEKIILLQSKVDDCNITFMGLPVEHQKCIQDVMSLMEGGDPAGDTVEADAPVD